MARKHDVQQFRQACREVGLTPDQRYRASEALHGDKRASGQSAHMTYAELLEWLRQWKASNG
jgi:hypothetical protein